MTLRDIRIWIVKRFYGALDNIIATFILAGVVYIIGVMSGWFPRVIVHWPLPIPLFVSVIALLPVLIFTMLIVRRTKKKVSVIRPFRLQVPTKSLDLERFGFSQYIEPDPLLVDNSHRFLLIQQKYVLEGYDGTFILRYKGENVTTEISRCFRDSIVGDSAADVSQMGFRVLDKTNGVLLKWNLLKDEPYEKLIEIYYHQPLCLEDIFDIEFSCRWPGTFTRRDDYVFYPIHYYKHSVEKLVGELVLNAAPSYVEGIRFDGKQVKLEVTQPFIRKKRGKFVVRWEIENPKYIYILQYGRQDI